MYIYNYMLDQWSEIFAQVHIWVCCSIPHHRYIGITWLHKGKKGNDISGRYVLYVHTDWL